MKVRRARYLSRLALPARILATASVLTRAFPQRLVIAQTNYRGLAKNDVEDMVRILGATFTTTLSMSNTHLVCREYHGAKYEKGMQWKLKLVNHRWLEVRKTQQGVCIAPETTDDGMLTHNTCARRLPRENHLRTACGTGSGCQRSRTRT